MRCSFHSTRFAPGFSFHQILFPWDAATQRFAGEQIFLDRSALIGGA